MEKKCPNELNKLETYNRICDRKTKKCAWDIDNFIKNLMFNQHIQI